MSDDKRVKGFEDSFGFGPTDHPEVKPPPFRIMAVGDFRGATHDNRGPVPINIHDFDDVMKALEVRAFFEVENKLGAPSTSSGQSDKNLEVDVALESIKDFEPQNLAPKIPGLGAVNEFVRRARALNDGSLKPANFKRDLGEFQKVPALREPLEAVLDKLGPSTGSGQAASDSPGGRDSADEAIDNIFSMVESKKPSGGSAVDDLAASTGGGQKGIDVSSGLAAAERIRDEQLKLVMEHPVMRGLERRWRGLHLLCKRGGKSAHIEVFDGDFDAWQEGPYQSEYAGTTEAPLCMVVLDVEIENSPAGLGMIRQFGEAGANIQAPVLFSLGERFFGENAAELARRDNPGGLLEDARFDKWRSLRDKDESRWLVACLNEFALRTLYSRRRHGYEEAAPLMGAPAWVVASAVAQSMRRTGWPSAHTGTADGEVEQLATFAHDDGAEYPLETTFSDRALKELSKRGFTPLMCQPNNDSAWVMLAPTVHAPSKAEEEGKLGTLAYQLLAVRMGELVVSNKAALVVPGDMQASAENFAKFAAGLLADTGPGAGVNIGSEGTTLILTLKTGANILGGAELQLGVNLA